MKLYIDLDDVLADFRGEIERRYYPQLADLQLKHPGKWEMHEILGISAAEFWKPIDLDLWSNLPKTVECNNLLQTAENIFGKKNCFILTSPTLSPDSSKGKHIWVAKHFPNWIRRLIICPCKADAISGPGKILIDDRDDNVEAWGGLGFLVPKMWNSRHMMTHRSSEMLLNFLESWNNALHSY